ncbi:site-specific integrase [Spirosoma sp.]|uniref:site-specific integrase n=1 Tax=Spirosoma sp. TaxID=1899569 RepID=UPI0026396846|nr:site-specific integrase [Spirosoma sp.]MCX6216549.1 phage integrase SAM-like domain-containing protein [Spirosoma sp.]
MEKLFWAHPSKKSKDLVTIYFRITINGSRAELGSTGIQVLRRHWNPEAQRITARTPEAQQQNQTLDIWREKASAIYNDLLRKAEPFTVNNIKKLFKQEGKGFSFVALFELYLKHIAKDPEISAGTCQTYEVVKNKVAAWLTSDIKQADLPAESFGLSYMEKYRYWMRVDESRKPATIRKHTQTIKQVLTWGFLNDYTTRDSLRGYRVSRVKPNDPIFLTEAELLKFLTYQFEPSERVLSEVRDYFLICCFTGLAFTDIKSLRSEHFNYKVLPSEDAEPVGLIWLEKERVKTDVTARQPLHPIVKYILESRYEGKPEKIHVRPNQKTNLYLKVISMRVGITKNITTHVGRKTFANLCLNGGLYSDSFASFCPEVLLFKNRSFSTESTIAMMGRTSAKGLEAYAQVDERRIMLELKASNPNFVDESRFILHNKKIALN